MASKIFTRAAQEWQKMRFDYEQYLEHAYNAALNGTGGVFVNKRGRALHIDGRDLFTGPASRAYRYASEELIEWWRVTPRLTLEQYETQWVEGEHEWTEQ